MDKRIFWILAALLCAAPGCGAYAAAGTSAAGAVPVTTLSYAEGQSTVEEDMAFLKSGFEESEGLTDAQLQERYLEELYGSVKEKAKLRSVDKKALSLSNDFKAAKRAPSPALCANGAVTHVFGSTIPRILCRPLRVTDVQLQPGEAVTGAPAIGDPVNWSVTPASSGSGEDLTVHILIKPAMPDLVTNLVVHTDRRTYVLELVSDRKNITPIVAFSYPDWERKAGWERFTKALQEKTEAAVRRARSPKGVPVLNANYSVTGRRYSWFPVEVADDGLKTYITFPASVSAAEMPAFWVLRGKKKEIANYRVQGTTMIVDRIFKNGILRVGTGRSAETVYITRRTYKAEKLAAREASGGNA